MHGFLPLSPNPSNSEPRLLQRRTSVSISFANINREKGYWMLRLPSAGVSGYRLPGGLFLYL